MAAPPLPVDHALRILDKLRPLTEQHRIIVVGGQAIAFWARELGRRGYVGRALARPLTSKDLDLRGSRTAVERSAELLNGTARPPSLDDHTPNTGVVLFVDGAGVERTLDFIDAPYGLTAEDIRRTALPLVVRRRGKDVPLLMMHPERCMESRLHNIGGLKTTHDLALQQGRASIECARGFSSLLLDDPDLGPQKAARAVMNLTERIFRFAHRDSHARKVFADHGIDAFDAICLDERLPRKFREVRYPQMRGWLARRPERAAAGWEA